MKNGKKGQFSPKQLLLAAVVGSFLVGCGDTSMESHLESARSYATEAKLDAAIVEYKNAIQKAPNVALPRFELGKLYLDMQNYPAAEKELNKALELGYAASSIIPLLSLAYQQSGAETALADVDYRTQGLTAVESAEVGFYKLQALVQLNDMEEAEAVLNDLITLDTQSVYKGLIESYQYIIANDFEKALEKTESLRAQAPQNKDVLQQLAKLYIMNQKRAEAMDVYSEYVSLYPLDRTTKFAYASLLIEERDTARAEPIVDELLALSKNNPLLNMFKGIIASSNGQHADALSYLELAIQGGQSDQIVRLVAGFSAYQIQDFEAAQRHLTMIASSLPDNHPGLRMLADSMLQLGESEEALGVLSRVEGEAGVDALLFSKASYQLLRQGNLVGAQEMVDKTETVTDTAEDLARLGALQLSLNDIEGLVNLEQAVARAPESAESQNTLVRAYVATGQFDKASAAANEWKKQDPTLALPLVYLANIALAEQNYSEATALLDEADTLEGAKSEITYARVSLLVSQQKIDDALAVINAFIENNPSDVQALTLWYGLAAEKNDTSEVVAYTKAQIEKEPDALDVRVLLARFYTVEGNAEQAIQLLNDIKGDKQSPLSFWNVKGQAFIAANKVADAEAFFKHWLSVYPQDKNAVLGSVLIADTQNKYRDGLALLTNVIEKRPDAQLTLLKAYFHSMVGETAQAWDIINKTAEPVRELPFVQGIIGRLLVSDKKPQDAIPHIQVAYDASPNSDNALLLVAAYEMTNKKEAALTFLQKHVTQSPNDVRSAMLLAERQISGDTPAAMRTYSSILEITPDNFVVLNNLAYLQFQRGNVAEAKVLAERAVNLQSDNAEAVDTLAQILIAQQDNEEALRLYERIDTKPMSNEEVFLNYVELLLTMDKKALAERRLSARELMKPDSVERAKALKQKYGL